MSYASTDYNIGINMSCKKDLDIEKLSKLLSGIEGAEDYLVGAGYDSMSVSRSIQRNMESIAGSFMMTVRMSHKSF